MANKENEQQTNKVHKTKDRATRTQSETWVIEDAP